MAHPIEETIKALQRMKERVEALETRLATMEKAFQIAFQRGSAGFEEFLAEMDIKLEERKAADSEEIDDSEENDSEENDNEENDSEENDNEEGENAA